MAESFITADPRVLKPGATVTHPAVNHPVRVVGLDFDGEGWPIIDTGTGYAKVHPKDLTIVEDTVTFTVTVPYMEASLYGLAGDNVHELVTVALFDAIKATGRVG